MSNPVHLLIVDDEASIRVPLSDYLEQNGFIVSSAHDAIHARELLAGHKFDLIVLDVMMPGESGLNLCKDISDQDGPPVILLTAMASDNERILGLEIGADDYVTKPFNPRELIARIRAVLKRTNNLNNPANLKKVTFGDWTLDLERGEIYNDDNTIESLSSGELDLLRIFITYPNQVLSRDKILNLTKGREAFPFERSIDVMISRLRKKIETDPSDPNYVRTIWGGGYKFISKVTPIK